MSALTSLTALPHPVNTIDATALLELLASWADEGALRDLDLALARFVHQQLPDTPAAVLLATALVSERNGHGHVCLDLHQALQEPGQLLSSPHNITGQSRASRARAELAALMRGFSLSAWIAELSASAAVRNLLDTATASNAAPLTLAGTSVRPLLYLQRYWRHEQQIRHAIQQRLLPMEETLPETSCQELLNALFSAPPPSDPNWQKIACLLAARSRFAIITGGPGTGKTTTVVRLLALLQGVQFDQQRPALQIRLAAPTGKAAARLSESITGNIAALSLPPPHRQAIQDSIPKQVSTLHRLLGSLRDSRKFRHNAANPLAVDLVVVDEASMMDVDIMARLTAALPAHARLILLGDKDQLASVEAGSVLADLCKGADEGHYIPETAAWLKQYSGEIIPSTLIDPEGSALQQATASLRHSYRFSAHPGIGSLAALVNTGAATPEQLNAVIAAHPESLSRLQLQTSAHPSADSSSRIDFTPLEALAVEGYRQYLRCLRESAPTQPRLETLNHWAAQVFTAHNQFQLLSAMRQGSFGVDNLNARISKALQRKDLLPATDSLWYHGRPVMLTRNDYGLNLMNGDVGICMQWPGKGLRVAFADDNSGIRWVLPSRLQEVETVFAMTVHKSQGSEFTHTALILPDTPNPVLSKELIYTAITRSKERFTLLYSEQDTLRQALAQRVERVSGL